MKFRCKSHHLGSFSPYQIPNPKTRSKALKLSLAAEGIIKDNMGGEYSRERVMEILNLGLAEVNHEPLRKLLGIPTRKEVCG